MRILLSILIAIAPTLGFAQSTGKVAEFNATMGTQSIPNFVVNPNAEKNTAGVTATGTGASVTASTTFPFFGTKSFRFGGTTGNTIVGTFSINDFATGMTDGGSNCYTSYWLSIDSLGTMTVSMKMAGVTQATQTIDATLSGISQKQYFLFYRCGELGQDPSLEFSYAAVSGDGSNLFNVDEVFSGSYDGPSSMSLRTNEATYTPTYTGFGTVSTSNMKWYQDGAYLYVYGSFIAGTPTGVEARMSLPTGYTSSSTISTLMICGDVGRDSSSTTLFRYGNLCEPNVSYITFGVQNSTTNVVTKSVGTTITTAGNLIYINTKIPIAGANNALAIPAFCINNPDCQNNFSAKVSAAGVVSDENYSFITGNCSATAPYTCTWDTSRFSVIPTCQVTSLVGAEAYITAQSTSSITIQTNGSGGSSENRAFNLNCSRAGTDVKPWGPIPLLSGMLSVDATTSIRNARAFVASTGTVTYLAGVTPWLTSCGSTSTKSCTFLNTPTTTPQCTISNVTAANSTTNFSALSSSGFTLNGFATSTNASSNIDVTVDCEWSR